MSFLQPFGHSQTSNMASQNTNVSPSPQPHQSQEARPPTHKANGVTLLPKPLAPLAPAPSAATQQLAPKPEAPSAPDTTTMNSFVGQFEADPASSRATPQMPAFSQQTQQILDHVAATRNLAPGTPEWEAARKRVLEGTTGSATSMDQSAQKEWTQSIATAQAALGLPHGSGQPQTPTPLPPRGRGRGRPPLKKTLEARAAAAAAAAAAGLDPATALAPPAKRGRGGRGRGRGRGGRPGRGSLKRKRGDDEDDGQDDVRPRAFAKQTHPLTAR